MPNDTRAKLVHPYYERRFVGFSGVGVQVTAGRNTIPCSDSVPGFRVGVRVLTFVRVIDSVGVLVLVCVFVSVGVLDFVGALNFVRVIGSVGVLVVVSVFVLVAVVVFAGVLDFVGVPFSSYRTPGCRS